MKITLNLSPAPSVHERFGLAWAVPVVVVGLAAFVLLARASLQEYREYRSFKQQVAEVQRRVDTLRDQEATSRKRLQDPAGRDLLREVHFVNGLIDERQLSVADLTARVSDLLPDDAYLTGLALTPPKKPGDDPTVRIGINARGEEAVEDFINDLEDAPDFKDVSILNQGFQEESSQGEQVNIICTARYLPQEAEKVEEENDEPPPREAKPPSKGQQAAPKGEKPGGAGRAGSGKETTVVGKAK
jgi:hypothetical protein